jgi:AraC-like DNA-binding protein
MTATTVDRRPRSLQAGSAEREARQAAWRAGVVEDVEEIMRWRPDDILGDVAERIGLSRSYLQRILQREGRHDLTQELGRRALARAPLGWSCGRRSCSRCSSHRRRRVAS